MRIYKIIENYIERQKIFDEKVTGKIKLCSLIVIYKYFIVFTYNTLRLFAYTLLGVKYYF